MKFIYFLCNYFVSVLCCVQLLPTVMCLISGCTLATSYVAYMCATKPDIRSVLCCYLPVRVCHYLPV